MKKYYFISGLPRSGSTLLCNILAQNPKFHSTATSGVLDVIFNIRNNWNKLIEFRAAPNDEAKKRVMKGVLDNFYDDVKQPVVFDKSRGWLAYIEMAEEILGEKIKILVPVRDIRDVISSYEKMWRKSMAQGQSHTEAQNYFHFQTTKGRCETWLKGEQPIGLAYNRLRDAVDRGLRDRLHFVEFEKLTSDPAGTMKAIYEFLGEDYFEHNFNNVEQITKEDDRVHGFLGMHDIRSKVAPIKSDWREIVGPWVKSYEELNFWAQ